ncbi:SAM-dependent methyltransferase [Burkholderia sp. AW49-1]
MEGNGSYNLHAIPQADGGMTALPLLTRAASEIPIEPGTRPVVIADYGASQGKNSLVPMRTAVETLRKRMGPYRPIFVVHTDLPGNDFNTLFDVLETAPQRYVQDGGNVYAYASGKSFYETVFPPESIDLGWCSYAAMWLSAIPDCISDHFFPCQSAGAARTAFERQAALDWLKFLSLRARELRPGGRLLIVLGGIDDDGSTGLNDLMDHAAIALSEMVDDGIITVHERLRMIVASYPRRKEELLAPFRRDGTDGSFEELQAEFGGLSILPDPAWTGYEQDRDARALATGQALFFRSAFLPSLASALESGRSEDERRRFGDVLEQKLKSRLAAHPGPLKRYVQTLVLTKRVPIESR